MHALPHQLRVSSFPIHKSITQRFKGVLYSLKLILTHLQHGWIHPLGNTSAQDPYHPLVSDPINTGTLCLISQGDESNNRRMD